LARAKTTVGGGFDDARQLTLPGMASTELKVGEVAFFRLDVHKGDSLQVSVAVQKPWWLSGNDATAAKYALTIYDDDQVQVIQKQLEITGNPPDAQSLQADWDVELSGALYIAVSGENTGQGVLDADVNRASAPNYQPLPGHVVIQVCHATPEHDASNDTNTENK
jgi:hypothetical protein